MYYVLCIMYYVFVIIFDNTKFMVMITHFYLSLLQQSIRFHGSVFNVIL